MEIAAAGWPPSGVGPSEAHPAASSNPSQSLTHVPGCLSRQPRFLLQRAQTPIITAHHPWLHVSEKADAFPGRKSKRRAESSGRRGLPTQGVQGSELSPLQTAAGPSRRQMAVGPRSPVAQHGRQGAIGANFLARSRLKTAVQVLNSGGDVKPIVDRTLRGAENPAHGVWHALTTRGVEWAWQSPFRLPCRERG